MPGNFYENEPSVPRPRLGLLGVSALIAMFTLQLAIALDAHAEARVPSDLLKQSFAVPQKTGKAIWGPPVHNGKSAFPIYKDLGASVYQMAIAWNDVAVRKPENPADPSDPSYVWPSFIQESISEAKSHEMEVLMMIIGTPSWANGGRADRAWAPKRPSDFATFAGAMSRKYPDIKYWMVWGEPSRKPNFKPLTPARYGPLNRKQALAPRNYGKILDKTYRVLKSIDSLDLVVGGNTFTAAGRDSIATYQWIKYMRLPGGRMPRMDLYGHNPFGFREPNLRSRPSSKGRVDFSDLGRLVRRVDRAYPEKEVDLFLSEWGVPGGGGIDAELLFSLDLAQQARWVKAGFSVANELDGRVHSVGWCHPFDRPELGITTGLMTANGEKKPSYFAFRRG